MHNVLARIKDPTKQIQLANLVEQANLSVHDLENVLMKKSARGRFFVHVRKNCTMTIPPLLAQRLTIVKHDALEARIRHGKLTLAKIQGLDALRLCTKASQGVRADSSMRLNTLRLKLE